MTKLSIIIPCYNSEKMIGSVVEETIKYLNELRDYEYEFVLVNDCSPDHTFDRIRELVERYPFVKGVDLAKNSGQHNAILAGLRHADGDLFMGMDDDMQTHPSQIHKLLDRLNEGYDVVYGHYKKKKTSWFRSMGSNFNNFTVAKLLNKPVELKVSSFWVVRRFVRDEAIKAGSSFTNMQGLFLRATKRMTNVDIEHFERMSGSSGYTLKKMFRLWSSVLNYSMIPLRLPFFLGIGLLCAALIHLILLLIFASRWAVGLNLIAILVELLFGMLFLGQGLQNEYLGRMFMVTTAEPQSVVREYITHDGKEDI